MDTKKRLKSNRKRRIRTEAEWKRLRIRLEKSNRALAASMLELKKTMRSFQRTKARVERRSRASNTLHKTSNDEIRKLLRSMQERVRRMR